MQADERPEGHETRDGEGENVPEGNEGDPMPCRHESGFLQRQGPSATEPPVDA